jgi:hypothetical protein
MSKHKEINVTKPPRPDKSYLSDMVSAIINSRITIIICGATIATLLVIVFALINQPKLIAVIDRNTGETFTTVSNKITQDALERQLLFYSKKFCENYLNLDHVSVIESRKWSLSQMHPKMRSTVGGEKFYETREVVEAIDKNYVCSYKWILNPRITVRAYPKYTVFCQFNRILKRVGYKPIEEIFNIKLDWVHLVKNPDPFKRPHDLLLIEFEELQRDSEEFKNQLNLSYKS